MNHDVRSMVALAAVATLVATSNAWALDVPAPPIALADRDGLGLEIERLDVRVAAHGPLALTELDLVFRNDRDADVEGRFTCTLPAHATVSRFAWGVDGRLVEGEVVERRRAAQVYAATTQRGSGAALLSQERGNRFVATVSPVCARSTAHVLLSYSTLNPLGVLGTRALEVPLVGLTRIGRFTFRAVCRPLPGERVVAADWFGLATRREAFGDEVLLTSELDRVAFAPATNVVVRMEPGPEALQSNRLAAGDFVMTTMRAGGTLSAERREPDEWHVLVDTSASVGRSQALRTTVVQSLLEALEAGCVARSSLVVSAFDLEVAPLGRWRGGSSGAAGVGAQLRARGCMGATDLGALLKHVGDLARSDERRRTFVLVTDGVPSEGARELNELQAALGAVPPQATVHVVALGAERDEAVCRALTQWGRGRLVVVPLTVDVVPRAQAAAAELRRPEGTIYQVVDADAAWVEPAEFRDVAPGDELVFFSRRTRGAAAGRPTVKAADGTEVALTAAPVEAPAFAPLLEREAWRAYLRRLERESASVYDEARRSELRAEQVRISTRYRVLCPHTSMLVLKTPEDFERYGIQRTALADVMVVADRGIELQRRTADDLVLPPSPRRVEQKKPDAKGSYPTGRDPEIKLFAPADTARVVAIFPWGLLKPLVKDKVTGAWRCRFVIPRAMAHGDYDVVLVLTRGDGSKQRLLFSFRADKTPPRGQGAGQAWRTADGWTVSLGVRASDDVVRVMTTLPDRTTRSFVRRGGPGVWRVEFALGAAAGPTVTLPVVLFDGAHNRTTLEVEVELP